MTAASLAAGLDRRRPLPELMAAVTAAGATGVLGVGSARGRRDLYFVGGELRAARSSVEGERLGEWLAGRGVVSSEEVALGLTEQAGSAAPPLGHVLVRRGVTDRATLEEELEALARTIIHRASSEQRLDLEFVDGGGDGQLDTLPNATTQQLILDAARRQPDQEAVRRRVAEAAEPLRPVSSLDDVMGDVDLTPSEAFVLSVLERSGTVAQARSLVTLADGDLDRVLYCLLTAGLVTGGPAPATGGAAREVADTAPAETSEPGSAPPSLPVTDPRGAREAIVDLAKRLDDLTHYQVLKIRPGASYQQVYDAWQVCDEAYHPSRADREPETMADLRATLQTVHARAEQAFDELFDPARRTVYDKIQGTAPKGRVDPVPGGGPATAGGRVAAGRSGEETAADLKSMAEERLAKGDVFEAHRCLERACQLHPSPENLLGLARLKLLNPKWTRQALDLLRRALEADPRLVAGWRELVTFWRRRGKRERERKALERVLALAPDDAGAVARHRELVGPDQAEAFLRRVRGEE